MPLSAQAALYLPGETLDPACAPTDSNCGISTVVASSTANSIPYYAANGSVLSATSTFQLLANGTASTTNLIVTTSLTLGTLSGFLKATAGAIAASLINLASDVTGILPIGSGGTGWGAVQASAIPYGAGTGALATTTAGTAGYVLAYLNGIPTWTATSSINNGVTAVTGTWPIISSGGATPNLTWGGIATSSSISAASGLLYATGVNTLASISTSTAVSMSITGLAGTATALATPRAINGVNFDGTANIVVASTTLLGDTNTWSGNNIFTNTPVLGTLSGFIAGNSGNLYQVATSSIFGFTPASNAVTITGAYPLTGGGDLTANRIFSLAFGTTTSNTWANTQTFTNPIVIGSLAGLVGASSGTTYAVSTSTLNIGGTASNITGIAALANGGTGLSSITGNRLLYSNANGTALLEVATSTLSIGGNAATVTTNANLTGVVTSTGNATVFGTQNAGVLGVAANGSLTAPMATSTLYGTGVGGQVLGWSNTANGLAFIATSTDITGFTTGTLSVARGGTGVSTLTTAQLLYGNGTGNVASVATTTLTLSGFPANIPAGYGKLVGGSDTTFTWWGLATTSQPASSNLLVSNGTSGVYGVATTSATCSTGVSCTGFNVLGGSNPSFALAALGSAGVLGAQTATTPSVQATSTLYGTGVGGQVLGWSNTANGLAFIATSTDITGFTTGTLSVARGGTGVATLTSSQLLYGNGTGNVASVATTTLTLSGFPANIPAGYGKLVGGSDTTFTWWGLATTSQPASSNLLVSNGTSGVYGVGTTSATCGTGVSCTGFAVLGTANPSFALAALGSAGVLGAQTATTPSVQATSTLYGTGVGGQVLGWNNNTNGIAWVATSTSGGGTPGGSLGQLQWNSDSTFAGIATTTLSLGSSLSYSGTLGALVGGASGSLTVATSSLYSGTTGQFPYFSGTNTLTATSSLFLATSGSVGIGTTSPSQALSVQGNGLFSGNITLANLTATGTLTSNITTGTAPLAVNSTTKVVNLNADLLDGLDSSAFGDATAANQTTILTRIGTNADATTTPAAASSIFSGMKFLAQRQFKMQTFTSSGTWTWPGSHVSVVWVTMVGSGGGGGGGGNAKGGGGGGAGEEITQYPVSVSGNVTVTIGAGGLNGGIGGGGGDGNSVSFGSVSAIGGKGGGGGTAGSTNAGGASNGNVGGSAPGGAGGNCDGNVFGSGGGSGGGGGANGGANGGAGGSCVFSGGTGNTIAGAGGGGSDFGAGGNGGNSNVSNCSTSAPSGGLGTNGGTGGGGGGGGWVTGTGAGCGGGSGGSGIVIVEWFE